MSRRHARWRQTVNHGKRAGFTSIQQTATVKVGNPFRVNVEQREKGDGADSTATERATATPVKLEPILAVLAPRRGCDEEFVSPAGVFCKGPPTTICTTNHGLLPELRCSGSGDPSFVQFRAWRNVTNLGASYSFLSVFSIRQVVALWLTTLQAKVSQCRSAV